uniref:Uncharacterized protein n=1 Tax=Lactuca sativa TaxID=4236 RepID=A0A9R1VMS2_LACSA|nr:hypothetical protein LSAT_V11C500292480 [Lactuca sativa]
MDQGVTPVLRHFFKEGRDCDAIENGASESFNYAIRHARRKPIITMLEEIRIFMMERISIKELWGLLLVVIKSMKLGIPCLHGVAAISSLNQDAETYVSQSYSKEAYLKCYNYSINPLNGNDMWPEVPYRKSLPPKRRRLPGRPLVKRKRDAVERELSGPVSHSVTRRGALIRRSICKEPGHNKKKCPSKQQTNTSAPSSSRGSGAGPSQPPPVAAAQPLPVAQPPPLPPPAARPVPRRGPIGRSGRRQYFEMIVKMALRRNTPGVGSSAENPAVLD